MDLYKVHDSHIKNNLPVPFPRSYWVIPGLFLAGEYPGAPEPDAARQKLGRLIDAGIRQIINLMETDETDHDGLLFDSYEERLVALAEEKGVEVGVRRFPIVDRRFPTPETMAEILDFIDENIENRIPVYVHCWGGIGRTGTVVGCFLIRHGLASGETVLEKIAGLRKRDPERHRVSPETPIQREFLRRWHKHESGSQTG
ncbi:MAG: hypothetical protein K9K62_06895 [Desulfobacteraceae bacterium]|nr:hypothetical protein [Desulfobacteraceae bacterium]MCF8036581.1 hypothetical protein [Desulfobacteraceae bacterium]